MSVVSEEARGDERVDADAAVERSRASRCRRGSRRCRLRRCRCRSRWRRSVVAGVRRTPCRVPPPPTRVSFPSPPLQQVVAAAAIDEVVAAATVERVVARAEYRVGGVARRREDRIRRHAGRDEAGNDRVVAAVPVSMPIARTTFTGIGTKRNGSRTVEVPPQPISVTTRAHGNRRAIEALYLRSEPVLKQGSNFPAGSDYTSESDPDQISRIRPGHWEAAPGRDQSSGADGTAGSARSSRRMQGSEGLSKPS